MRSGGWIASRARAWRSRTRVTPRAARAAADAAVEAAAELGGLDAGVAYPALAIAALAAGDVATAQDATEAAWPARECPCRGGGGCSASSVREAALAGGDLVAARRWADDAVIDDDGRLRCRAADHARPRGDRTR